MTLPTSITQARQSEQNRKKLLQSIHRVIDQYQDGNGATDCMKRIMQIVGRDK